MIEARGENRVTFRQIAQRIRVPAGFVLAPLFIITARPTVQSLAAGAGLAAVGLAIRAYASGYLKKNMELTTTGPYGRTRNPLYLGTFLLGAGIAASGGAWWFIALFLALYLLIYYPVMMAEADTLRKLFPEEYERYSRAVPMFFPRATAYRAEESRERRRFDKAQYLRHREYRALIGTLAVFALLAAKMLLKL